jgi:16S rRNA (guanine527-N7)-methyltransferase
MTADELARYFPGLTASQQEQLTALDTLYRTWNAQINVISRQDIDHLYEHHVLHSLAIARFVTFMPGADVMDVGTGGGFPGIPLAILFPNTHFHLVDSIGKKLKVAASVAESIGLKNVTFSHNRAEMEKGLYDFIVSRAVMPLNELVKVCRKNIRNEQRHALSNGLICLKGGDLTTEIKPFSQQVMVLPVSSWFREPYFETKQLLYLPLKGHKTK